MFSNLSVLLQQHLPKILILRQNSLLHQILLTASLILLVFFLAAGLVLTQIVTYSLQQGVSSALQAQVYALLAAAEGQTQLTLPEQLPEERLNQLESQLYAWVIDDQQQVVWQSASFKYADLFKPDLVPKQLIVDIAQLETTRGTFVWHSHPDGLFVTSLKVQWQIADDRFLTYTFNVAEDRSLFDARLSEFRQRLWGSFGLLGILLLVAQWVFLKRGFSPLKKLQWEIAEVDSGRAKEMTQSYPVEIYPVVERFNLAMDKERQQRKRYETTLADLAHSLKTPLTVLKTLQTLPEQKALFDTQIDRMDRIIRYQLHRSVIANTRLSSQYSVLLPIVREIVEALEKTACLRFINSKHCVQAVIEIAADFQVPLAESDVYEVMGCLLDNAFKHCQTRVNVTATRQHGQTDRWSVMVADDGPGLSSEQRAQVLKRGVRFDESFSGQGLGLHIVQDIVRSYGLTLDIVTHPQLSGAAFRISRDQTG